jgi:hypothetical protein
MSVGQVANDFEVVVFGGEWFLGSPGESLSDDIDQVVRQVRKISHREVFYLSVFAVGVPKEVSDIHLPLVMSGDGGDVNGSSVGAHTSMFSCAGEQGATPTMGHLFWLRALTSRLSSQAALPIAKKTVLATFGKRGSPELGVSCRKTGKYGLQSL